MGEVLVDHILYDWEWTGDYVKLTPKEGQPEHVFLAAATSVDQVREFNRRNHQPAYIAESWQGSGGAVGALERWGEIRSAIDAVPYAPSIPSVPYVGTVRSFLGP